MTRSRLIVALMVLNLALILLLAWLARGHRAASAADSPDGEPAPGSSAVGAVAAWKVVKTNVVVTNAFQWTQVESDDYRTYIERLRAIGVPEQTIRDLVIADIDKLFAPQLQALNPAGHELKYWQPDNKDLESGETYRERQRQQREIDFRKREVVRQLLGADLVTERSKVQGVEDLSGRRLGFLPEEKRSQVRMVVEQFNDAEVALRQKTWEDGEALTEDDKAQLKHLSAQREAAIAKLLSPSELEQYQLAMSPLAYQVRDSLFGMNATEQEYVALYHLQKEFTEKWSDDPPADPKQYSDWETAQAELQAKAKETLGEQRYAQHLRAKDADFRQLSMAAARFNLAPSTAADVYEFKSAVVEARARVSGNRSLTPAQQRAALDAITAETEQTVKGVLGDKAFNHYLRTGQGGWIRGS